MIDDPRDWCYSIGPLNPESATTLEKLIRKSVGSQFDVSLIDHRQSFVLAWDADSVTAVIDVLSIGLKDPSLSRDVFYTTKGMLGIMKLWLEEDYNSGSTSPRDVEPD